jgi:hypothetical protein
MDVKTQNILKDFWRYSGALREARRNGGSAEDIAAYTDELTAIERHTDNAVLRGRCRAVLDEKVVAAVAVG